MFDRLFAASPAGGSAWPLAKIVAVLKRRYQKIEQIGADQGFTLFGVSDNGVNFVVALIGSSAPDSVAGIGFLARFVGFPVSQSSVEAINKNLHFGVASLEAENDLYVLAEVEATGAFDETRFARLLDAWRRDLMVVLHALSGTSSTAAAFPTARMEAARSFSMNVAAPAASGAPADLLRAFVGQGPPTVVCKDCGGRGRRGVFARDCEPCDGSGFIKGRR
jgi:hypothetical protein